MFSKRQNEDVKNTTSITKLSLLKKLFKKYVALRISIASITCLIISGTVCYVLMQKDFPTSESISYSLHCLGILFAIYVAMEAATSSNKAESTNNELKDTAYIVTTASNDFLDIYKNYLIEPLQIHSNTPIKAYLLLSTPAYGYPVLGMKEYSNFQSAFSKINFNSEIQIIFFSPDGHIHHWINTLLWSKHKEKKENFAIDFGHSILSFMDKLQMASYKWNLWVSNETSLRLFAFDPIGNVDKDKNHQTQIFLVLSDKTTIPIDQWRGNDNKGFKGRGFPILTPLITHFISGEDSFFHQLKRCPYSLSAGEEVSLKNNLIHNNYNLNDPDKSKFTNLKWDYVLGRTEQRSFDFACFDLELKAYLDKRVTFEKFEKLDLLDKTCDIICDYFSVFFRKKEYNGERIGPYLGQTLILSAVATELKNATLLKAISPEFHNITIDDLVINNYDITKHEKTDEWKSMLILFGNEDKANRIITLKLNDIKETLDQSKLAYKNDSFDKFRLMIYLLLSSGFLESAYAAKCRPKSAY